MKNLMSFLAALCFFVAASCPLHAQGWFITTASFIYCNGAACSSDGLKLVTIGYPGVEVSTNRGVAWMPASVVPDEYSTGWSGVASSADGVRLVAVSGGGSGAIYISPDSGVTWMQPAATFGHDWSSVACSPDGTKIVAGANYDFAIYTSTDSGATWVTNRANEFNNSVAMSADGVRMVVASYLPGSGSHFYGGLQYSVDSGATWHLSDSPTNWNWSSVACSANGNFMVAVGQTVTNWNDPGPIYISTNSGVNWEPTQAPRLTWLCVACSADGSKITAGALGDGLNIPGGVYSSSDQGATWFANDTIQSNTNILGLNAIASSTDGKWLVGADGMGEILVNPPLGSSETKPSNLTIAFVSPASVVVSWPAAGSYTLQQNSRLVTTNWTTNTYPITTAHGTNSITITPPTGNLFFRLSNP